jgi:hypothetical protein
LLPVQLCSLLLKIQADHVAVFARKAERNRAVAARGTGGIARAFHINSGFVPECIGSRLTLVNNVALERCSRNVRLLGMT